VHTKLLLKDFLPLWMTLKKDPKKWEDRDIKDESQLKYESTPEELQKYTEDVAEKWKAEEDES
jgi:hypothetical protein